MKASLAVFAATASSLSFAPAMAATDYKIEPTHTSVDLKYTHLGYSRPVIRFMSVDGVITIDENDLNKSKVEVVIDVTKVNSGVAIFDEHLKGKGHFDVEAFPTAKFASTKVTKTSDTTADIEGNLTVKGVTKPVTLKAKFNKKGLHPFVKKMAVGFSATTQIKRSEFGLSYGVPYVSDEVDISIEVEAINN